jgi:pimeloyl-ACP methyl ester carboxylesterase
VSYGAVEAGLCAGMATRLKLPKGAFVPNNYRNFTDADRDKLEDDPDAVFFKRTPTPNAHSFVIPFYWGFREEQGRVQPGTKFAHGQNLDYFGNRLDKDSSKEGGPFANATSSLPDMWNKGFSGIHGFIDHKAHDPLRPVLDAPGHMYMVLAAQRLAALIQMIRDYNADETVNIVSHSQGSMISLLAQAFLLQDGRKPVDTLIMNNSPYSLEDELPALEKLGECFKAGTDERMEKDGSYDALAGTQTLHARLQTLTNIVQAVAANKHAQPEFQTLPGSRGCTVGTKWAPGSDRDNRGKIYLYFSPEDATVALNGMRGIGWQGVPDFKSGNKLVEDGGYYVKTGKPTYRVEPADFRPLSTIGPHFFQRVFTKRLRAPASGGVPQPVLVGAPPPYDFAFCLKGEEGYVHVNPDSRDRRGELRPTQWPVVTDAWYGHKSEQELRDGVRTITGEQLPLEVMADLDAGALRGSGGKDERPDAIDAAVAATSDYGEKDDLWSMMPDPQGASTRPVNGWEASPQPLIFDGPVQKEIRQTDARAQASAVVNAGKTRAAQKCEVVAVYRCLQRSTTAYYVDPTPNGQWLVQCKQSAEEARLYWQRASVSRSYHSAIFGNAFHHEFVTAYDLSIGQGNAVSNPEFRAYLCAVADWRLKKPGKREQKRVGILTWNKFLEQFSDYYSVEPPERKLLIEGNASYYSTGNLPGFLPVLPGGLPPTVVSEIDAGAGVGVRIEPNQERPTPMAGADKSDSFGDLA